MDYHKKYKIIHSSGKEIFSPILYDHKKFKKISHLVFLKSYTIHALISAVFP
jgi:hypothetical protein